MRLFPRTSILRRAVLALVLVGSSGFAESLLGPGGRLFPGPWSAPARAQVPSSIQEALGVERSGAADGAQEAAGGAAESSAEEEAPPSIAELVPRGQQLAEEARRAIETIEALTESSELETRAAELAADQSRIESRLDEALSQEYVRDDRIKVVVEEGLYLRNRIADATETVSGRLEELDALRRTWRERRERWRGWRDELRSDPQYEEVYREPLDRTLGSIDGVLRSIDAAVPELIGLQQRLQGVESRNVETNDRAQTVLRTWRERLFRRTAPVLFSAAHRQALAAVLGIEGRSELGAGLRGLLGDEGLDFRPRDGVVVLLQALVAFGLGFGLRRLRAGVPVESRWARILGHPWAIGIFVATTALWIVHGPLPAVGRLAESVALAASAAVVASGVFSNPCKRALAYGISGAFVLLAVSEAVALPVPLLRSLLAGLALAGAPALGWLARRSARSAWQEQRWFHVALRLGIVALTIVFGAELLGYHFLAQWLLEASVLTAFAGFVVTFLARLGRGALYLAFRSEAARRSETVAQVGGVLSERLMLLLEVGLVGYAVLYLSSVWDLAESPGEAWDRIVGWGVTLGAWELTVGKLLLAAIAVYLALVASWVVRTLLDRTVFERREFERGVRDSFFTLLHYTLMVLGAFLALSLMGVDLSSFALLAGALGVGIGFGLQNVVNNFVSGLILLFERPVRIGDVVDVAGERGQISKIGLRSTVLTTFNGAEQVIPNGNLISEKLVNWTLTTPRARLELPVSVAYGNDPERVIDVLLEIGQGYELALDEPQPMAIFSGFGESSLDFELRVWLRAFEELLQARSELAARIVRRLAEEGIEIPFPQRDLHLRSVRPEAAEGLRGPAGAGKRPLRGPEEPDIVDRE